MRITAFTVVIVLGMCLAVPLRGRAIVCHPKCPAVPPAPKVSEAMLTRIVERYLAENPPVLRFELRQPLGSYAPVAYDDLTRAGILRIVDGKRGRGPGPRYDLTVKGRKFAGEFINAKRRPGTPYAIEIPVGQFQYVPGSAVLSRDESDKPATTFKYRFKGNAKASMLLRLGPAIDWVTADYWRPHVNLTQVGRVGEETLPLRFCYGAWIVRPPHPCEIP